MVSCWDRKDFVPSSMWTKRMRRFWKMQWSREACREICPEFRGLESSIAITFHTSMEFGFWGPHTGKKESNLQGCNSLLSKIWVCLNNLGKTPNLMVCHHDLYTLSKCNIPFSGTAIFTHAGPASWWWFKTLAAWYPTRTPWGNHKVPIDSLN